jgi:hypothetical protein
MKRNWKIIFPNGKRCTMLLPEPADDMQAWLDAYRVFLIDGLRVE